MKLSSMEKTVLKVIAKKLIEKVLEYKGNEFEYDFPQDHLDYLNDLISDYGVRLDHIDSGIKISRTNIEEDTQE